MSDPLVSVVIPAYNAARTIVQTVESLRAQSLTDFEMIVVNDGSTDTPPEILVALQKQEPRLRVVHQANGGYPAAMNFGLKNTRGKYIARLDADDISLPTRLQRQVDFLETHPDIGVCGAYAETFGEGIVPGVIAYPTTPPEIRAALLFFSPMVHSSVMSRRQLFLDHDLFYATNFGAAADYQQWIDYSRFCKIANIPEVLIQYRIHPGQVTQSDRPQQQQLAREIRRNQLRTFGIETSEQELDVHCAMGNWSFKGDQDWLQRAGDWLLKLYNETRQSELLDRDIFSGLLADYWFSTCIHNTRLGWKAYRMYLSSPLCRINPQIKNHLRLAAKAILRRV